MRRQTVVRRGAALLVDAVPALFLVLMVRAAFGAESLDLGLGFVWFPVWVLARLIYHTPLEGLFGLTPGKWLFGLRVRGGDGGTPGLRAAFTRSAWRFVDGIFGNLVGAVLAAVRHDGGRLGDYFARTTVSIAADSPLAVLGDRREGSPEEDGPYPAHPAEDHRRPREHPQRPAAEPAGPASTQTFPAPSATALAEFARDLTELAALGDIPPVVGRESEVRQVERTLGRTKKNNPVLVGEAGVGKTAIVEGLARKAAGLDGEAPGEVRDKRILELDLTAMEAGADTIGVFPARMRAVVAEASARDDVILFVDEVHRLMSVGSHSEAGGVAADILKPALARGQLKMVGATTPGEFRRVEKDPAMERRLEPVTVPPLSVEDTTEVLRRWASAHLANVDPAALAVAAPWADRYLAGNLPDKALSLVDDAVAGKRQEGRGAVTKDDLARVIRDKTGIKVSATASDKDRLRTLEAELGARVVGQEAAARTVARTVARRAILGGGDRPASLLFLGPSGVGKTEMAKALAAAYFGGERRMVRVDMSEMQGEGAINRLVGSPRGYVGSEGGGQLTGALKREPSSVVLLDEVEKAHASVYDVLLQLLGDGRLTDGLGNTVDCRHSVVVMTSNVGAERILAGETDPETVVSELLARGFRPEVVGRIDEKVVFGPLSPEALEGIVGLLARPTLASVRENHGVRVELDGSLVSRIASEGYDNRFGARELAGAVRRLVEDPLTELVIDGDLSGHDSVVLWYDEESGTVEWESGSDEAEAEPEPVREDAGAGDGARSGEG